MSHSSRFVRLWKGATTLALVAGVFLCGVLWNVGVVWVFAGVGCVLVADVIVDLVRVVGNWHEFWERCKADAAEEEAIRRAR